MVRSGAVASGALLAETPVRLLFSLMVCSFAALLQIMTDLADPLLSGRCQGAVARSNNFQAWRTDNTFCDLEMA